MEFAPKFEQTMSTLPSISKSPVPTKTTLGEEAKKVKPPNEPPAPPKRTFTPFPVNEPTTISRVPSLLKSAVEIPIGDGPQM
jgi:hypothetical protein